MNLKLLRGTESMTTNDVLQLLIVGNIRPEKLTKFKGEFIYRQGFFYTHGNSAHKIAEKIKLVLPNAKITSTQDVWLPFRGAVPLQYNSHFQVRFRLD